jgi:hypothetical protein
VTQHKRDARHLSLDRGGRRADEFSAARRGIFEIQSDRRWLIAKVRFHRSLFTTKPDNFAIRLKMTNPPSEPQPKIQATPKYPSS